MEGANIRGPQASGLEVCVRGQDGSVSAQHPLGRERERATPPFESERARAVLAVKTTGTMARTASVPSQNFASLRSSPSLLGILGTCVVEGEAFSRPCDSRRHVSRPRATRARDDNSEEEEEEEARAVTHTRSLRLDGFSPEGSYGGLRCAPRLA